MQWYMSTSCPKGSWIIRAFFDVKKHFVFSDLVVKDAKSEIKVAFQRQRRIGLSAGKISLIDTAAGGKATLTCTIETRQNIILIKKNLCGEREFSG